MAVSYHDLFVKNGIPIAESEALNDCLAEFIVKRGTRSTSVFQMIRYVLNIHDENNRIQAGKNVFGARWEDVTQEDLEAYMNYESLERVPSHSITKEDVADLKYIYAAMGDLIEALDREDIDEQKFNDALARYYVGFAKLKQE
jgi:hypothetical protein